MENNVSSTQPETVIIPPEILQFIATLQEHKTKSPSNAGRPTVMTDEVLAKLKEAFLMGCTDREACLFADIHPATLYRYQEENPEFCDEKELWKENPFVLARTTILKSLKDNVMTAEWYLERKRKDEFSQRVEQTGADGKDLVPPKIEYIVPDAPSNPNPTDNPI